MRKNLARHISSVGVFSLWLACCALLFFTGCSSSKYTGTSQTIRVLTYNIHHGEGMDGKVDIERIAKVITDSKADIVALQEVDRGVERTKKIDIMTMLADLTGMTYAFGKNIDYQGGDYGNGVLTKFPILQEQNLHYKMIRTGEQRGLLQLLLEIKGEEVVFMNTHIDYREDNTERISNVKETHAAAEHYAPRPVIVCGDFNDTPESRTITLMKERFIDSWGASDTGSGFSYPTDTPKKRIDYIFLSKNTVQNQKSFMKLRPVSARVLRTDASDHLPVLVELELNTSN